MLALGLWHKPESRAPWLWAGSSPAVGPGGLHALGGVGAAGLEHPGPCSEQPSPARSHTHGVQPQGGVQRRSRGALPWHPQATCLPPTPPIPAWLPGCFFTIPMLPAGRRPGSQPKVSRRPRAPGTSEANGLGQPAGGPRRRGAGSRLRRAGGVQPRAAGVRPCRLPAGAGAGSCAGGSGAFPPALPAPPGSPPPRRGFAPFSRPLRFLSSSGSYSFPARKQPCLLKKPPWPQSGPGLGTRALPA